MDRTPIETDTFPTTMGSLEISFLGHGSMMMNLDGKCIQIDPFSRVADYGDLPKGDLILITHEHRDHLDLDALSKIRKASSSIVLTALCSEQVGAGTVMQNGDTVTIDGIRIDAVPAYNLKHKRDNGQPFHPKGYGNGYVLHFGDILVYIAGDTENIPEMKSLQGIKIAFLPVNLPYTMTPEMAADAAKSFMPKILYPYHFGNTDIKTLVDLLEDSGIEVRIRSMS